MTNNDIFKKLRVALQLRDDQIVEILELVDFRISKGEIGNFFRNNDHPKFVECKDQVLRNFLNGLVIFLRGTKDEPKNPMEVLAGVKSEIQMQPKKEGSAKPAFKPKSTFKPKSDKPKSDKPFQSKENDKKPFSKSGKAGAKSKPTKVNPVEKVKFTIKKK